MAPIYDSLARANGRGSAGECPALHSAKTPFSLVAVGDPACRVAAGVEARANAPALTHPAGASPHSITIRCDVMSARRANWTMLQLRPWPAAAAEAKALRDSAMRAARQRREALALEYAA